MMWNQVWVNIQQHSIKYMWYCQFYQFTYQFTTYHYVKFVFATESTIPTHPLRLSEWHGSRSASVREITRCNPSTKMKFLRNFILHEKIMMIYLSRYIYIYMVDWSQWWDKMGIQQSIESSGREYIYIYTICMWYYCICILNGII
jgi:hypothetical protein